MAYNPVIRGLNASWKLIGRGFAGIFITGEKVRFCRVIAEAFLPQKLKTKDYISQKISVQSFIEQKVKVS